MRKINYRSLPKPIDSKSERTKQDIAAKMLRNCISFIKNHEHNKEDSKFLDNVRSEAFGILFKQTRYRLHPGYFIEITPNERQEIILNSVFDFVKIAADLIDYSSDKAHDTNKFLLANKEYLYTTLGAGEWQRYVGFLRAFVDVYKNSDMIYRHIPGGEKCTLSSDNRIYIPALGLGLISPVNEIDVRIVRQWKEYEGYRYLPSFDILKSGSKFYIKIKYKEDTFFLRKNKDLLMELTGTIDVITGSKLTKELKESKSFSRIEISESTSWVISNSPVNHAHQRDHKKKW